ncbi:hypothetical protein HPHPA6_0587 [Helicobacter pylori Hp A-6]|nr:hypothetical protein HPHPA6_0587 [Helicobacter pylori Hp A-6]
MVSENSIKDIRKTQTLHARQRPYFLAKISKEAPDLILKDFQNETND